MTENPLLNRIRIPGETFRLPSGGLFYEPGVISDKCVDGEIYVYPMTAIDEIALKTPDLLFSGNALQEVFSRCIPDVLNLKKMLAKDVDFLMICLRKVSYGSEMEITYDHNCPNHKEHSYKISVQDFLQRTKRIDPVRRKTDFRLELKNGQVVEFEPITFEGFVQLQQLNDSDMSEQMQLKRLVLAVSNIIKSVDSVTDRAFIQEWLAKIPPILMKPVTDVIETTTEWGSDFKTSIICTDCGQEVTVQAPLNPLAFFI